jgi:hypothetical protein
MSQNLNSAVAVIGIDIGKNTFHVIGLDDKGAIILRHKLSRGQVYARLANIPPCLIGIEEPLRAQSRWCKVSMFSDCARRRSAPPGPRIRYALIEPRKCGLLGDVLVSRSWQKIRNLVSMTKDRALPRCRIKTSRYRIPMQKLGRSFELSATDLVGYLNCRHLSELDRAVVEGRLGKPKAFDPLPRTESQPGSPRPLTALLGSYPRCCDPDRQSGNLAHDRISRLRCACRD